MADVEGNTKRKICWPEFDLACLEGGCLYCADGRWIRWDTIRRKVRGNLLQERAYRAGTHNPRIEQQ